MGISHLNAGASLALGRANPSEAAAVMRWDLVNPWAKLYELNSTHPLTALRVRALNRQAEAMHQSVQYPLPADEPTRLRGFPVEVMVWAGPAIGLFALWLVFLFPDALKFLGITIPLNAKPLLLIFTGIALMLRVMFRYRGQFQDANVGALLEDLEVSQMRPRAVRLKGEILGRGEPGAFWSPDLVLRDSTGIIYMLYRQSIPFVRFLFAITASEDYVGQEVVVEGWFRRGLAPYVEMSKLTGKDNITHRAYSRWVQLIVAAAAVAIGWLWLHPS